ncbi:MAG: hypothetical protein CHACPFDD_01660 [Phycisphaerae bacterium]|nr:hypothetical protein [Phycisphaerae bacterium]
MGGSDDSQLAPAPDGLQRHFPCQQCGAALQFAPQVQSLVCPYCGVQTAVPQTSARVSELDFRAHLRQLADSAETLDTVVVRCRQCAAEVTAPPDRTAFACPYCGTDVVLQGATRRLLRPGGLLTFQIERDAALAAFRHWLRRLWFAPSALKRMSDVDQRLCGMYVPYWTYDCRATSHYTGMRGDNYTDTETYTTVENGRPVTRTRTVVRTRWTPVSGSVSNTFDDLLVLASRSLPRKYADRLEPWDLPHLTPFREEYLSGFQAESYQIDLAEGFESARAIMDGVIAGSVRSDIGGDHQQIHSIDTRYDAITFKHVLLPVWISTYRYREHAYRFLVNARSGEVQGERPWSAWKIVGFVLLLAALAAAVVALAYLFAR